MSSQAIAETDPATGVTPAAPWRVASLVILPGYRLEVSFQDGVRGVADLSALKHSADCGVYEALKIPAFFEQARLDLGVVTWPNGADLDPAWMHEEIKRSKTWLVPF